MSPTNADGRSPEPPKRGDHVLRDEGEVLFAVLLSVVAAIAAVAVPLLPLFFVGFVVWLLVRASRPAVA